MLCALEGGHVHAVRRGLGWLGLLGALLACRAPTPASAVQVRIRNASAVSLQDVQLGVGVEEGGPTRYGSIAPGETTDYRPVQPFLSHYRRLGLVTAAGKRYELTVYPEQHLGMRELPAGRYSFVLTLKDERPLLRIDAEPRY
jgi:hypothetical protein